jgi:ribosomal protein S18 acetylase RimI-like enzyme
MRIESLAPLDLERDITALGELLHACVHVGASVGYVLPFGLDAAEEFWRKSVLPALEAKGRIVLVLREGAAIAGTVQLDVDTPPNQPHRAEVRKLLVHPTHRRRGLARALMIDIEARARALGRSLLTLDTRTGDAAEPLYASLGYVTVGSIPGYCLDPFGPRLDATTIMYKTL